MHKNSKNVFTNEIQCTIISSKGKMRQGISVKYPLIIKR